MHNQIPPLESITGKDLMKLPIEPLGFTISDILPHGLFILAGVRCPALHCNNFARKYHSLV